MKSSTGVKRATQVGHLIQVVWQWIVWRSSGGSVLQGTAKRWEQVAAYVRTRTMPEVVEMVKHGLKSGKMIPKQEGITVAKKRQVRVPRLRQAVLSHQNPCTFRPRHRLLTRRNALGSLSACEKRGAVYARSWRR